MFKQLQKLGKAFMLPIAILPAAGLLLGIGGALSNPATIASYPFLDVSWLQAIFGIMRGAGDSIFGNLPLLMCVGLVIGLVKQDKGTAGLAAVVSFCVMNGTLDVMLQLFNPDGQAINTGIIGSIAIGFMVVFIHNRYRNIELPSFLGFFGGSRFIPIASSLIAILIGALFFFVWPPIQNVLIIISNAISKMGPLGTFFYGFFNRLLGVVGLHHAVYPVFWFTELGGVEMVAGTQVIGAQNIWFSQLADVNHTGLFTEGTKFFAGKFPYMMFGLPAACLAMYHCVPKERRPLVSGLFISAALTSFLTGITEPIEFMFLFVAPWLYLIHALLDGLSFFLMDLLNVRVGNTFSGGAIDFTLFGILQGNEKTNWIYAIIVGVIYAVIYYALFKFCIKKFKIPTPGLELDDSAEIKVETKGSIAETAIQILEALGNKENIEECDACITRLRVSVKDISKVDKDRLKALGATDVLEIGGGIQAIYGSKAVLYKNVIVEKLDLD